MKIGVIGGTQGVGKEFIKVALAAGHVVTALARTPSKLDEFKSITIITGDVLDKSAVDQVVKNQDVIINSLGSNVLKGPGLDVCSQGSPVVIESMKAHGVKRTIVVTSFGISESWNNVALFMKPILWFIIGNVLKDKAIQEKQYFDSDLDYTIVRPAGLTDAPPTGTYRTGVAISGGRIARADVADFMLKQLTSTEYSKKCPTIAY